MLVLERREGQSLIIADSIRVTVLEIGFNKATIEVCNQFEEGSIFESVSVEGDIQVCDGVSVKLLMTTRKTVKLGTIAPREVPVHRKEVIDRKGSN